MASIKRDPEEENPVSFNPVKNRQYGSSKHVISRLFKQAGGIPTVMDLLGLSPTRTYALADPNDRAAISFERVEIITLECGARAAAEHLAHLAGRAFLPVTPPETSADWHSLASRAGLKHADNISTLLKSLGPESKSPGHIDTSEAQELLEKVDKQIALLALQRQKLVTIIQK